MKLAWLTLNAIALHHMCESLAFGRPQQRAVLKTPTRTRRRAASLESLDVVGGETNARLGFLPRGDELDGTIGRMAGPAILNFLILPLVGTVDTLWVGKLGDPAALAALGAANQVFSSVFFVVSFVPAVVTPLVAAAHAAGDEELVKKRVRDALWISAVIGATASVCLGLAPRTALSLALPKDAAAATWRQAVTYLTVRAGGMVPAIMAFVGFAAFRGRLDVVTPLRVSLASQGLNLVLDPLLIFGAKMGVGGAALATACAELLSAMTYLFLLVRRGTLELSAKLLKPPPLSSFAPLIVGGAGVLARSLALNTAFLSVTRATQALDPTGGAAAAHTIAMQVWQLGGVVLFALSSVAAVLVPAALNAPGADARTRGKGVADRMLGWGLAAGFGLAALQLAALPLLNVFSPVRVSAPGKDPRNSPERRQDVLRPRPRFTLRTSRRGVRFPARRSPRSGKPRARPPSSARCCSC
mmetsp:Transcript_13028/g.40180  ORF Transcript_13028/g.40180 Transcript_13028/m.40180 type:complete len:471 (-) Transcript_13028:283-1695(-)